MVVHRYASKAERKARGVGEFIVRINSLLISSPCLSLDPPKQNAHIIICLTYNEWMNPFSFSCMYTNPKKKVRDIPLKPPLLATIKSNNYLINALTCEEAEDHVRAY